MGSIMNKFILGSTLAMSAFAATYVGEDPATGDIVDYKVIGDEDYDCYETGWCCDLDLTTCLSCTPTGICDVLDYRTMAMDGTCEITADGCEAVEDAVVVTDPTVIRCPVNFFYRILATLMSWFIGWLGLDRAIFGFSNWWIKLIFCGCGVVLGAIMMALGAVLGQWWWFLIGGILIAAGDWWHFVDATVFFWGRGMYYKANPKKCYMWLKKPEDYPYLMY